MKKVLFLLFFFHLNGFGQEVLTLQTCLRKIEANRFNLSQEKKNKEASDVEKNYHILSVLPNLSAYSNINTSFGRRLDPFTNTFGTKSVNSQSYGLTSATPIFSGFAYFNNRTKLELMQKKTNLVYQQSLNQLKIKAIEQYVELCKIQIQEKLSELRIKNYSELQFSQRKLLQMGRIPVIDTLKNYNSLLEETKLKTNLNLNSIKIRAELNFLMGHSLNNPIQASIESLANLQEEVTYNELFEAELIKIEMDIQNAEYKSNLSNYLPSIALNTSVGTGFSTNNKNYSVAGNPTLMYNEQLSQNLYENIGFYINLPIFDRGQLLKARKLNIISQYELNMRIETTVLLAEKKKYSIAQEKLGKSAEQEIVKTMVTTSNEIYEKSLILYKEGRYTFSELQASFLDWQTKILEMERLKLEIQLLNLYEN